MFCVALNLFGIGSITPEMADYIRANVWYRPQNRQDTVEGHMTGELTAVLGRGLSVLEIHDFISGEFEPVPLQDVWDFVKAQETAGAVKLTTKPAGK